MKTLKTFVAVVIATIALSLTGCQKDPEDLIIGTWDVTKIVTTTTISGTGYYDGTTVDTTAFADGEAQMTFKNDGTVIVKGTDEEDGPYENSGRYTVDGNNISITVDNDAMSGTITEINKKEMILRFNSNMSEEGMSFNMDMDMYFKKA